MKRILTGLSLLVLGMADAAGAAPATALSPADTAAAFKAAGFKRQGHEWVRCDDTQSPSRQAGALEVTDLNGDGAPEAWIRETSTVCYGDTAEAFVLLTKKPTGWTVLLDEVGIADTRPTKHLGWPDIEVGGPGMGPMPVYRFNGVRYLKR